MFAISTLRLSPLAAGPALARALAAPQVIVTSPAAARFAGDRQRLSAAPGQRWYALGEGTAAALRRRGVADITVAARGGDSEALLAMPGLQQVRGQAIGLLTAPGGRDLIAPTLAERGARLRRADVYARSPMPIASGRLRALSALPRRCALLVSSDEALSALWTALDRDQRLALRARLAVASSERLRARLRALGFADVIRADGARPSALIEALAAHVRATRFR